MHVFDNGTQLATVLLTLGLAAESFLSWCAANQEQLQQTHPTLNGQSMLINIHIIWLLMVYSTIVFQYGRHIQGGCTEIKNRLNYVGVGPSLKCITRISDMHVCNPEEKVLRQVESWGWLPLYTSAPAGIATDNHIALKIQRRASPGKQST